MHDYSFDKDGERTLTSSYYYDLDSAKVPYLTVINNADRSARFTLYDNNGRIYCMINSQNGNTNLNSFRGTMRLYSYNDDNSYIVTVYKNSLLPKAKYIIQKELYTTDGILTETIPYNNGNPSK